MENMKALRPREVPISLANAPLYVSYLDGEGEGAGNAVVSSSEYYYSAERSGLRKRDPVRGDASAIRGLDRAGAAYIAPIELSPHDPSTLIAGGGAVDAGEVLPTHLDLVAEDIGDHRQGLGGGQGVQDGIVGEFDLQLDRAALGGRRRHQGERRQGAGQYGFPWL